MIDPIATLSRAEGPCRERTAPALIAIGAAAIATPDYLGRDDDEERP